MKGIVVAGLRRIGALGLALRVLAFGKAVRDLPRNIHQRSTESEPIPVPPLGLLRRVTGTYDVRWFLEGGKQHSRKIHALLDGSGLRLDSFHKILDFGCGCGRILRHCHFPPGTAIYGTDPDRKAIAWCNKNLGFANFEVCSVVPPLGYGSANFDFVYAFSVFTHFSEELQSSWMKELSRVLRDGAYLLITTHGEGCLSHLSKEEQRRFHDGKLVVKHGFLAGTNLCGAYHPPGYLSEKFAQEFVVLSFVPGGPNEQDMVLLKKL